MSENDSHKTFLIFEDLLAFCKKAAEMDRMDLIESKQLLVLLKEVSRQLAGNELMKIHAMEEERNFGDKTT